MKVLAVFAVIFAVSFGAAIQDRSSLRDDLQKLGALVQTPEMYELMDYYWDNDEEVRTIFQSDYFDQLYRIFMKQPEVIEFVNWVSEQTRFELYNPGQVKQIALKVNNNYKPGWKAFMEAYIDLIPFEKIDNFVAEKVAEGGVFAVFWSRLQALRPTYERVIRSPEFMRNLKGLEALGFDVPQFDGMVRDLLGWN